MLAKYWLFNNQAKMKKIKPIRMIFQEVGGMWRRIDSQEPKPPTLADTLKELNIVIDDKTEFARIRDYLYNNYIFYRNNGGKIIIEIWDIE